MASSAQELVGLEARSRDGDRIGKVKGVICGPGSSAAECLVIKYSMFRDLVVPADVAEREGRSVTLPFTRAFLDVAPRVATSGEMSDSDQARLDSFYHPSVT